EEVRVIKYGSSVELCGGTHVANTGNIGMIRIVSESSVAAGIRRIEAVTAAKAEALVNLQQDMLKDIRAIFNNAPDIKSAIRKAIEENSELKKQAEDYLKEKVEALKNQLIKNMVDRSGVKLIRLQAAMMPDVVKDVAFRIRTQVTGNLLFVAGTTDPSSGKPLLTVMLSDDMVAAGMNASALIREAAKLIQGGGGGQPHFAQAGGKNADGISAALDKILELAQ
ncbi:MAG: alanine--tRNA ligase, partial [Coprobacter sp.]|nr:alanine--tRNA ligase [Coprobacter sp.]